MEQFHGNTAGLRECGFADPAVLNLNSNLEGK
jgi:hypothetical protein